MIGINVPTTSLPSGPRQQVAQRQQQPQPKKDE